MGENVKNHIAGYDSTIKGWTIALGIGKASRWRVAVALGFGGGEHRCPEGGVPWSALADMAHSGAWWRSEACPSAWRAWAMTLQPDELDGLQRAIAGAVG